MLEIPEYPDKEALFAFMDGLQSWVRLELQRGGVQDLASAIAVAESLIEFRSADRSKQSKERNNKDTGGEEANKDKGKEK